MARIAVNYRQRFRIFATKHIYISCSNQKAGDEVQEKFITVTPPVIPYYKVDKASLNLFGNLRTEPVKTLPALRGLESVVSRATYNGRIFDRYVLGCGFLENTAHAYPPVIVDRTSMLIQNVQAFPNPDSETWSAVETAIRNKSVVGGNTKVFWPFNLSNVKVLGNLELTGLIAHGWGAGVIMAGDGTIGCNQTKKGNLHAGPGIKLDPNVTCTGDIWLLGTGFIALFTKETESMLEQNINTIREPITSI